MRYRVELVAPTTVSKTIIVEQGQDWDGRPVTDEYDAGDLAYDLAVEDKYDGYLDWQVDSVTEIE